MKSEQSIIMIHLFLYWLINDEINPDQLKASDKSIKIGIAHQPDTFIQASNTVDLQISGHSCGGSIYIPYFGPLLPIDGAKTYNHGQYEKKGATLLVSNGIKWSIHLFHIKFLLR